MRRFSMDLTFTLSLFLFLGSSQRVQDHHPLMGLFSVQQDEERRGTQNLLAHPVFHQPVGQGQVQGGGTSLAAQVGRSCLVRQ